MDNLLDFFPKLLIAILLGIGGGFSFVKGIKGYTRFLYFDYEGHPKERLKNNLLSNFYICCGSGCLLGLFMGFQFRDSGIKEIVNLLPFTFCIAAFVFPIAVLGSYWHSYQMNKMWGGFMPTLREKYGYAQPVDHKEHKIDPSKVKVSRKTTIIALAFALLVFFGMVFILSKVQWNGPVWIGILVLIVTPGLAAFSVFMTIVSTALSRKIQKLRDEDPFVDDD